METGIVLANNIKNKLVNDSTKNDFKAPDAEMILLPIGKNHG